MPPPTPSPVKLEPRALRILRARRRTRFALLAGAMLLAAALLAARTWGGAATDHSLYHQQRFLVVEVAEGDTLLLAASEAAPAFTVKLVGVDANGSADARDLAARACGRQVQLYLESVPTRNHAGELLAYVYAADGTLVNARLIEEGVAFADRRWDYSFLRTFLQAEEQAQSRKRGMWPQMTEAAMPEWRRRWLAELQKEPWKRQEWRRADEP